MLGALNGWNTMLGLVIGLIVGGAIPPLAGAADHADTPPAAILTNAAQLRAVSAADAARLLPVKMRGVVTAASPNTIFLQDATGGTFINVPVEHPAVNTGELLEVTGVTYPGRFITGISPAAYKVIGNGELPVAPEVDFDELVSARRHYERVQVHGIVRSVARATNSNRLLLNVAMGSRKLEVQIIANGPTNLPALVDAEVRIVGLAAGYINNWRQLISPQLLVSRNEDIHVGTPPQADPFSEPLITSSALLNFSPEGISSHRVRVQGVVTLQEPYTGLYLRDGERGLRVQTDQRQALHPGDVVEVAGFPAMGRFSAFLENAEFRVTGKGSVPAPLATSMSQALTGTNEANLITLEAQVIEELESNGETIVVARAADTVFRARIPGAAPGLRKGSHVRMTGVCRVEEFNSLGGGFGVNARSIELLLRSPMDVLVNSAPSWWTARRLGFAAAIALGIALAAFVWIAMLRRRISQQTVVIREKVQREAALEERHRMAREMHDTLAQSFSGLGFQLDALGAGIPQEAEGTRNQLETARQMVREGQEGFRRSLLNLRAQELERGSLVKALGDLARQITSGTGIELRCELRKPGPGLSESVEAHLLRIGQECLANAVRHGHPRKIELTLEHEEHLVRLQIADDGAGFDPEQLNTASNGHYGWRGIRERAAQIGANVDLKSERGCGTIIIVTLPV